MGCRSARTALPALAAPDPSSLVERGIVRTLLARTAPARSVPLTARARRIGTVIAAAALVGVGLTGCSAASASSCVQPGDASQLVHTSGAFGSPHASFPHPIDTSTLQKSTVKTGSGNTIGKGQMVRFTLAHYDASTGKSVETFPAAVPAGGKSSLPGLQKALLCTTVGSRIVVTGTEADIAGSQGSADQAVVLVVDVEKAYPSRATGSPRPGQPGMPTVVLAPNGQPGIKITENTVPTKLRTAVLRQGSGAVVKKVDSSSGVLVNYTAVTYNDPTSVAGSSWVDGSPVVWPTTDSSGFTPPADVVKQLVGQNVGSQVLVVTPGSNATAYVIDILGIWK
ncbi:hypothetical protein GCM10027415_11040 [Humibacter ginsengisoli]